MEASQAGDTREKPPGTNARALWPWSPRDLRKGCMLGGLGRKTDRGTGGERTGGGGREGFPSYSKGSGFTMRETAATEVSQAILMVFKFMKKVHLRGHSCLPGGDGAFHLLCDSVPADQGSRLRRGSCGTATRA